MTEDKKPERDWMKEPYNTWDTLAAMRIPPMQSDKGDIAGLSARLKKIEDLLVQLVEIVSKLDAENR